MIQSKSTEQAKSYFNESLQKSDYYLDTQEVVSFQFHGKIAERLGIANTATKNMFHMLVENVNPITGDTLTLRKTKNRTIGYDINFHCPKSVSLLHVLSKDNHILEAFQESVHDTMQDMENDSLARVRKNGKNENRKSGELLWSEFVHQTARPVKEESPDPHLHCHCYTFNVTWDSSENNFKAGQFRNIKRDMPYYQARFHKRLADCLLKLGYRIRKTKKGFEVVGVPQSVLDHFSKRTNEVEAFAKKHEITNAKERDKIGSITRSKKKNGLTMSELLKDWRKQLNSLGMNSKKAKDIIIRHGNSQSDTLKCPKEAINHALLHHFERSSVCQERRILETAYKFSLGSLLSIQKIDDSFSKNSEIIKVDDTDEVHCTTLQMVDIENRMLDLIKSGKDRFPPLYNQLPKISLTGEQGQAIEMILSTKDQVCVISGRAGTGKTTLMTEAVNLIEQTGKLVTIVAPTAEAARGVLKDEGFTEAQTLAHVLTNKKMQTRMRDGVLWVDEAGLLGVQDMEAILQLAVNQNAKVILSGDTKQHASVAYGDALRLITLMTNVERKETNVIHRQKNRLYKDAVMDISNGNALEGFKKLDLMNSIIEVKNDNPIQEFIKDYLCVLKKKQTALVISPTHKQGEIVTGEIRKSLKDCKQLGDKDCSIKQLINLNLTSAEKKELQNYNPGLIIQFNQNHKNFVRGSCWNVDQVLDSELVLKDDNENTVNLCLKEKSSFDVFQEKTLAITKNDIVKITRNGFDTNKQRLNNGQELKVVGIDKKERIHLLNSKSKKEYYINKQFGHITHGYCMTSHASQGKTVDNVFVFQPSDTFSASNLKQFYVSVSRGRHSAKIYTDDKASLFEYIARPGNRCSALELLQWTETKKMTASNKSESRLEEVSRKQHTRLKTNNRYEV